MPCSNEISLHTQTKKVQVYLSLYEYFSAPSIEGLKESSYISTFHMHRHRKNSICLLGQKFLATIFVMKTSQVLMPFSTTTELNIC